MASHLGLYRWTACTLAGDPARWAWLHERGKQLHRRFQGRSATPVPRGLVLAGTDLFYPPIGSWIAGWIANPGIDPATLVPYAKEMYDETAYEAMRAFRKPFITIHYYGFYVLIGFVVVHILAVVMTELREGGNLISAMFSGKKVLSGPPADRTNTD
jgi:hypothetical protein